MQNEESDRTQPDKTDRIQELIQAARDEERASLAVEAILKDIDDCLNELKTAHRESDREIRWVKGIVQSIYNNVATLLQLMAAMWGEDRSSLVAMQQKIMGQALAMQEQKDGVDIKVDAAGDVKLSADKVGRDKKDER